MSDSINDLTKNFKNFAELKAYSDAQYRTILELTKKINAIEKENADLKRTVASANLEAKKTEDGQLRESIAHEQAICEMQLSILRDRSLEGELTLEETKKVEIFTKLLQILKDPSKKKEEKVKEMDISQLLSLVDGGLSDAGK